MEPECIVLGDPYDNKTWQDTCGFKIGDNWYPVRSKPETIPAGTVMVPFVGFVTIDPAISPSCQGVVTLDIVFHEVDTASDLSIERLYNVTGGFAYAGVTLPPIQMPPNGGDLHVKWAIYIVNPSTGTRTFVTETGDFYLREKQCDGTGGIPEICKDGYLHQCWWNRWVKTAYPCDDFEITSLVNSKPVAEKGDITTLTVAVQCTQVASKDAQVKFTVYDESKATVIITWVIEVPITGKIFASAETSWDTVMLDPAMYTICAKVLN